MKIEQILTVENENRTDFFEFVFYIKLHWTLKKNEINLILQKTINGWAVKVFFWAFNNVIDH